METQKVILPFFYALFLPDFPQENAHPSNHAGKRIKSHQTTSYSFKVTKKSQNKAEVPFPPHSGIPLITLITYIDV